MNKNVISKGDNDQPINGISWIVTLKLLIYSDQMAATEKIWYTKFIGVKQYFLKNKLFKY